MTNTKIEKMNEILDDDIIITAINDDGCYDDGDSDTEIFSVSLRYKGSPFIVMVENHSSVYVNDTDEMIGVGNTIVGDMIEVVVSSISEYIIIDEKDDNYQKIEKKLSSVLHLF